MEKGREGGEEEEGCEVITAVLTRMMMGRDG
jgi:hypothetical protein